MALQKTVATAAGAITGISSMATRQVLAELGDAYARAKSRQVAIEAVGGVDALRRVQAGEPFDLVFLASDAIDGLAAAGHVDAATRIEVARSGVAIAVAAGAPHPDVATEQALRDAVLAARTVGYSSGPSGRHLERLFARWGIAETIASRIVKAAPGVPVASLVASGKAQLGFQQLSELLHAPGIEVIGPLPPEVQTVTVFEGAVCSGSSQREPAAAFLAYCASPEADAVKRRQGMEP